MRQIRSPIDVNAGVRPQRLTYLPEDPLAASIDAARIYFDCRLRGLAVRSCNDCLIAQTTAEHGLIL